jgi:hypothetical protein
MGERDAVSGVRRWLRFVAGESHPSDQTLFPSGGGHF